MRLPSFKNHVPARNQKGYKKTTRAKKNFTGVVCNRISHTGTAQSALVPAKITDTNANDRRPCSVSEINSET